MEKRTSHPATDYAGINIEQKWMNLRHGGIKGSHHGLCCTKDEVAYFTSGLRINCKTSHISSDQSQKYILELALGQVQLWIKAHTCMVYKSILTENTDEQGTVHIGLWHRGLGVGGVEPPATKIFEFQGKKVIIQG